MRRNLVGSVLIRFPLKNSRHGPGDGAGENTELKVMLLLEPTIDLPPHTFADWFMLLLTPSLPEAA